MNTEWFLSMESLAYEVSLVELGKAQVAVPFYLFEEELSDYNDFIPCRQAKHEPSVHVS